MSAALSCHCASSAFQEILDENTGLAKENVNAKHLRDLGLAGEKYLLRTKYFSHGNLLDVLSEIDHTDQFARFV